MVNNYMACSDSSKFLAMLIFVLNLGPEVFRHAGIEGAPRNGDMKTAGTLPEMRGSLGCRQDR